jgi:dTDP-glucose 4,6-dehydratase
MKNVLITGNLGFIGFNFCKLLREKRPDVNIFGVDCCTYAADFLLNEKKQWCKNNNIIQFFEDIFYHKNIIDEHVKLYNIDTIINFAAESHVDNSISGPEVFFNTNIIGAVNMFEIARKYNCRIHHVSTDEVYGITYPEDKCYEDYKLDPSSPYSSSKTSADVIALSYYKTFGTKITVSRCTNNFGPWQHTEKLIPTVISKALKNEQIPVYGDGNQRRHWIYVQEHNTAILDIIEHGEYGKIYNIAPCHENYISNMEIVKFILFSLNKSETLISHVTDRAAHDTSYYLYSSNYTSNKLFSFDLNDTIQWYKEKLMI